MGGKDIPLVLLETDPGDGDGDGDGRFLDALTDRLAIPTFRIPPSVSLVDLLAAIGHARAFVGSSPHGRSAAQAFGIPAVGNSEDLEASLSSALAAGRSSGPPPELERSLAARFNGVATAADEGLRRRLASQHGVATTSILIDALRASGRRVEELEDHLAAERLRAAGERIRLMEQVQDCQAETARVEAALRETEERARSAEDEREALRAEYVRFTTSRLYRYSTPLRGIYGGLRRALGLKKGESR